MAEIFISYNSRDRDLAQKVYDHLRAAGLEESEIWFDQTRLNPGGRWHNDIESACEASRVIVAILTPRWKESQWTKFEKLTGTRRSSRLCWRGRATRS